MESENQAEEMKGAELPDEEIPASTTALSVKRLKQLSVEVNS